MAVVLDFDGTITTQDTIDTLAGYACFIQSHRSKVDLAPIWNAIVEAYMNDYQEYVQAYNPPEAKRLTLAEEIEFLRGLESVDSTSRRRVEDSGLFVGVPGWILHTPPVAQSIHLRAGFHKFVDQLIFLGLKVVVLSVNWSTGFVAGVIGNPKIEIIANEIMDDGKITGPPGILEENKVLATCYDKHRALRSLMLRLGQEGDGHSAYRRLLYVGDSTTDLECLLAGCGVVMNDGPNSSVLKTLSRVGVPVFPVHKYRDTTTESDETTMLYSAKDFQEILDSGLIDRFMQD